MEYHLFLFQAPVISGPFIFIPRLHITRYLRPRFAWIGSFEPSHQQERLPLLSSLNVCACAAAFMENLMQKKQSVRSEVIHRLDYSSATFPLSNAWNMNEIKMTCSRGWRRAQRCRRSWRRFTLQKMVWVFIFVYTVYFWFRLRNQVKNWFGRSKI